MARHVHEIAVPGLAAPVGPYAHATRCGSLIFVSGLLALDEAGALVGQGNAATQADYIFEKLAQILQACRSDLANVAKLSFFLIDLADRFAVTEVRRRVFGAYRPASTLVQVSGLIGNGTLLEIEAIAAVLPE
jgi:2-iminobutanoate/2-iminopropanoate deaminase